MIPERPITKRDLLHYAGGLVAAAPLIASFSAAASDTPGDDQLGHPGDERRQGLPTGLVYVESNITADGANSIFGYRQAADGSLTALPGSPYLTGGTGLFIAVPGPGPFDTDQEVVIDRRRGVLYAVNTGSNSIAALSIGPDGALTHLPGSPYATYGLNPVSIGLGINQLVVVNADIDPSKQGGGFRPSLNTGRTSFGGGLHTAASTSVALPAGSIPSQALTANTGRFVFTCEFAGATIRSFSRRYDGTLRQLDAQVPPQQAGATSAPLPLGLWASPNAPVLYVGFATTEQLGVYTWDTNGKLTFRRTATSSGQAICWLRTADRGRRLYAVNTGNNSLSLFDTSTPDQPVEVQYLPIGGAGALVQFDVSADERFLIVLEQATNPVAVAQGNRLRIIALDAQTGRMSEVTSALLPLQVPANTIPQGVVTL